MARTVFCEYLKQDAEGLDFQLYPGELGKRIFNSISKQAWGEWIKKQTMLVNEKKLNMMNAEHRKLLEEESIYYWRYFRFCMLVAIRQPIDVALIMTKCFRKTRKV